MQSFLQLVAHDLYTKIGNDLIDITTVVQYHNALGKAYFFFIKPFHRMIVPRVAKELI